MSEHPQDNPQAEDDVVQHSIASEQRPSRPTPPSFWSIFDWRLLGSLVAVGLIGFMSCDVVNAAVSSKVDAALGRAPQSPNPASWKPGTTHLIDITVVTKDADRLACASKLEFERARCDYNAAKRRWPSEKGAPIDDNKIDIIQPYRTANGNHLVMVAGMWATPALAMRRHQEPARGVAEKSLHRFIARCKLRFIGTMDEVSVRWDYNKKWYSEKGAPAARAESCEVIND